MFAVLTWPMALSLAGSSSHDGLLITSAALMVAIASRVAVDARPATSAVLAGFLFAMVAGVTGRPPHVGFALLLPIVIAPLWRGNGSVSPRVGLALAAAVLACAAWMVIVRIYTLPPTLLDVPDIPPDAPSIERQIAFLAQHPGVIPSLVYRSIVLGWKPLITTSVGVLGWLDTLMPTWYYWLATAAFVLALAADRRIVSPTSRLTALAGWSALLLFVIATYVSIYLTWMGVGAADVLGVQGRYLLAGVPLAAWLRPATRAGDGALAEQIGAVAWLAVVSFVVVTYAVVPAQVIARYYTP
jgi:uncharacterized membrane protein